MRADVEIPTTLLPHRQSIRYFNKPADTTHIGRAHTLPPARPDHNENGRLGNTSPLFPARWQHTFDVSRR